ncbi:hypothetical protein IAU60_005788 [Kwoniella sp. DSM 27419]
MRFTTFFSILALFATSSLAVPVTQDGQSTSFNLPTHESSNLPGSTDIPAAPFQTGGFAPGNTTITNGHPQGQTNGNGTDTHAHGAYDIGGLHHKHGHGANSTVNGLIGVDGAKGNGTDLTGVPTDCDGEGFQGRPNGTHTFPPGAPSGRPSGSFTGPPSGFPTEGFTGPPPDFSSSLTGYPATFPTDGPTGTPPGFSDAVSGIASAPTAAASATSQPSAEDSHVGVPPTGQDDTTSSEQTEETGGDIEDNSGDSDGSADDSSDTADTSSDENPQEDSGDDAASGEDATTSESSSQ